jgi:hypothetical protein
VVCLLFVFDTPVTPFKPETWVAGFARLTWSRLLLDIEATFLDLLYKLDIGEAINKIARKFQ